MTARPHAAGDRPHTSTGGNAARAGTAFDETYTKPSKYKQWQEHSARPIAARPMTADEIELHRSHLICSYQCDDTDISFDFRKILDENDEDRDDCLLLVYTMKCVLHGKPKIKDIFTIKVPIPDEIKRKARHMQRGTRPPLQRTMRALPAPEAAAVPTTPPAAMPGPDAGVAVDQARPTAQVDPVLPTVQADQARPKLRRPGAR